MIHIPDNSTDYFLILSAGPSKWSRRFRTGPVSHFTCAAGVDARIVDTLHEEVIVEARDGIEEQVEAIVSESMEAAFQRIIPEVPFVAEIRVADSWGG